MADIFISYSQSAPQATEDLALDLTKAGHSVWFNSRLLPMDVFWKVIRDEIKAAKAVVVIWSARAINSEWVYAEAKLAHDMKKLICVRTPDVPAFDVPMPFNGYNVTEVDERQKIHEALAKLGLNAGRSAPLPKGEMEVTEVTVAWGEAKASGNPKLVEVFIRHYRDRHPFFAELAETFLAELPAGRGGVVVAKPAEVPLPQAGDVFLRIEPGMHTAKIGRIGVDAACRLMVTGSDDKTARLWALPEGGRGEAKLLRTLRVPIGEGDDGKVYAVALSPDGQWVAAGGWRNRSGGELSTSSKPPRAGLSSASALLAPSSTISPFHPMAAASLQRLAGAKACGSGRREAGGCSPKTRIMAARTATVRLSTARTGCYTVAYDGQIRRYGADGRLEAKAKTAGGAEPYSIAVHPKGGKLAVGFDDTTAVELYDAASLKRLYAANTDGISGGDLSSVAWSADGARLYAGGRTSPPAAAYPFMIWQDEGRGKRAEAPLSRDTIMQLLPCGAGIAAGAADPAFGLIAADGGKRVWQEGVTADMRDKKRDAFAIAADGRSVRFGLGQAAEDPVLFDLAAFRLADAPQTAGFAPPKTSGLAVSDWENSTAPKLNGKPIALEDYEISLALAIAPDASRFVLGTECSCAPIAPMAASCGRSPFPASPGA